MIKKNVYSVKSISIDSVISCVLAGVSFVCQVAAIILSYHYQGKGPKVVGLLAFAGLLMAIMGIVFCRSAWKSPDGGIVMKRVSGIVNTIFLVTAVILYILGWM